MFVSNVKEKVIMGRPIENFSPQLSAVCAVPPHSTKKPVQRHRLLLPSLFLLWRCTGYAFDTRLTGIIIFIVVTAPTQMIFWGKNSRRILVFNVQAELGKNNPEQIWTNQGGDHLGYG